MNERIEKLFEQALEEFKAENKYDNATIIVPNPMKEKFAELIVRECILIIQKGISLDGNTTEKFLRTMKHLKDIKEHFGIEE